MENRRRVVTGPVGSVCSEVAGENPIGGSLKGHGTSVKCRVVQGVSLVVLSLLQRS